KMQKAVQERDYPTMALYAAGIYALYKSIEKLSGGKDSEIRKWMMYGVAAYAGHRFLQNAGYDLLKMSGFKDRDYEVAGTPFEIMDKYIKNKPEYKDFDYEIAFRCSEVKLTTMDKLLSKAHKKGDYFIHPSAFPGIFPNLSKEYAFEMGLGEHGLKDNVGMSNKKFTAAQREYIRVGKQLYLTAKALRTIYNETLYQDENSDYHNIPYEEAIKDPTRKFAKVVHLLFAARTYNTPDAETPIFERSIEEAEKHLSDIFKGEEIVEAALGSGHFSGTLKGFPVVFVKDGESYKVYLRNDYKDKRNPGNKYTEVPLSGPNTASRASTAMRAVDSRMAELMAPLQNAGGRVLTQPGYVDGRWQTEIQLPAATEFGVANGQKRIGVLTPREDGKGLVFKVEGTNVRINIDQGIGRQFDGAIAVLPKIMNQTEFKALHVFSNGRRLSIKDATPGDKKLTLLIGKNRFELEVEYDNTADSFSIVGAQERTLLKSASFANEYIDALGADDNFELNDTVNDWKQLIEKSAPENFVSYFFKALAQETSNGQLDGINLDLISGSVPEYFATMILDSSRNEAYQRLRRRIKGCTTLAQVETARREELQDFNDRLKGLYNKISAENARLGRAGKTWDRDEFMARVIDPIRSSSSISERYSSSRADLEYLVYKLSLPGLSSVNCLIRLLQN
ncbi:MAG: hypothetical protein O3B87_06000, partial [bacterium]|nr:hypothetical protein [bacterium]